MLSLSEESILALNGDMEEVAGPANIKRQQGKHFSRKEKCLVMNVLRYFLATMNVAAAVKEASKALCCTERSIYAIKKEEQSRGLMSPKKRPKRKGVQVNDRLHTYDQDIQSIIRRKVHSFFIENIPPTMSTILSAINTDDDLPNFKRTTLFHLLKDMGFEFQKMGRKSILIERDDIIRWRHKYLRSIRKFREEGKYIVYTDESWVNVGHAVNKAWCDTTIQSARQAFIEGLSTGLRLPSGLGPRFALVHAGGEDGFIPGAELTFEQWFMEQLIPNIPQNSVIVIDNASYHSRKVEKIPTMAWRKEQIMDWLTDKEIPIEHNILKRDLLASVAQVKHRYDKNKLDVMAQERGHEVLRLPPYHCELNPIELVWAQVKHHIKVNNTSFKTNDMKNLIKFGYETVTTENWQNYIRHVKTIENTMWLADNLQDDLEEFIINVTQSSSDDPEYNTDSSD